MSSLGGKIGRPLQSDEEMIFTTVEPMRRNVQTARSNLKIFEAASRCEWIKKRSCM